MTKKAKNAKNTKKKKVVIVRQSGKPADRAPQAHKVKDMCQNSAVYNGSTSLQTLLGAWVTTANLVAANLTEQDAARATVLQLENDLPSLLVDTDNAEAAFATGVQTAAKDDVNIAIGMGMSVKATKAAAVVTAVPTGVRIEKLKTTNEPRLAWDAVTGAALYQAEMSVEPATNATWLSLYGKGRIRKLPPLAVGQSYLLRVRALDNDSKPTAWSDVVSLVG